MFSLDMGLLWIYLASVFGVLVVTGVSAGLIAWYTETRKKPAGIGAGEIQEGEPGAGGRGAKRGGRRHIVHGV